MRSHNFEDGRPLRLWLISGNQVTHDEKTRIRHVARDRRFSTVLAISEPHIRHMLRKAGTFANLRIVMAHARPLHHSLCPCGGKTRKVQK